MSVVIKFPLIVKYVFSIYVVLLLALLDIMTAVMIVPLVILSAHAILARPKAICIIGDNKDLCIKAASFVAEHLESEELHIFEAHKSKRGNEHLEPWGIYDRDEDMFYELVDEDDDSSAS
jgi:hypothetical protein